MERREFIKQIAGTGAIASATALSANRILGANERINVGLIGCGGRGRYDSRLMRQVPNVDFTAVCDVYKPHVEAAKAWAGPRCRAYKDFRKLLEQKDLDAVLIATPNHGHSLIGIWACQAGKDV